VCPDLWLGSMKAW